MKLLKITVYSFLLLISLQSLAEDFPAGSSAKEPIIFEHAIYLIDSSIKSPLEVAKKHLKEKYTDFKLVDKIKPENTAVTTVTIRLNNKVKTDYQAPTLESLKYSGKGVSKEQADKLQDVSSALIMDFSIPLKNRATALKEVSKFVAEIAKRTNGIIWDEETRLSFGHEAWVSARVNSFQDGIPDISKHITIHAYKDGEYIRAISLGMIKFGLPDIEVSDFSWSKNRSVGNLVNLLGQQLYDGSEIGEKGVFVLNADKIKHKETREKIKESLYDNAVGEVEVHLIKGKHDEGDPNNRIIEVVFDHYPGKNKQERLEEALSSLWGWKDEITQVKHNDVIKKASEKARTHLPGIKKKIKVGLAPGEYYLVKAPFKTPSGDNEWMWVEIISWENEKTLTGLLKNQPYHIPTLKAGEEVTINISDIFDYIHKLPDGSSVGNETGALIQKFSQ